MEKGGQWYLYIGATKQIEELSNTDIRHVVGVDRGLRFLAVSYDEKGKTAFFDGKAALRKREAFAKLRAKLQAKGTKSAKRVLKRISGRENRWMSDVNHRISRTLVSRYGPGTLFVLEDLEGVSTGRLLDKRTKDGRRELRSWPFFQLEQFLTYKALIDGSAVVKVDAHYTSQRCPKCGQIRKENRKRDRHEYICSGCEYRSNDDRVGAMNIQLLGTMYIDGQDKPAFTKAEPSYY